MNFFLKNHTCFLGHAPRKKKKKGRESILKEFLDFDKKNSEKNNFLVKSQKSGNNRIRERQNARTME